MNLLQLIVKKGKLSEEASSDDELSEAAKPSDLACNFDVLKFDGENCRKAIARKVMSFEDHDKEWSIWHMAMN
ncbi:hypothetical protein WN943_001734 [Citrus x changshan-huyou]